LDKETPENYIFLKEMKILKKIVLNVEEILNGTKIIFVGLVDLLIEEKPID
jgi:hypothetical protein